MHLGQSYYETQWLKGAVQLGIFAALFLSLSCGTFSKQDKVGEDERCNEVGEYRVSDQKLWKCEQNTIPYSGVETTKEWYLKLDCSEFTGYLPQMLGNEEHLNCINANGDLLISTQGMTPFCGNGFQDKWIAVRYKNDLRDGIDQPFYLKCTDREPKCFPGRFEENEAYKKRNGSKLLKACPESDEPFLNEPGTD